MPDDASRPAESSRPPTSGEPLIGPRRRPAQGRDAAGEADRAQELAGLADSMKALSERLEGAQLGASAPAPPLDAEARAARRWKRSAQPELLEAPPSPAAALPIEDAARPLAPMRKPKPKPRAKPKKVGIPIFPLFAAQALGVALLAAGYFLGRGDSAPSSPSSKTANAAKDAAASPPPVAIARGVSEPAFLVVNSAMAAAKHGDAADAREKLEAAQRANISVPGSDYRLALLAIQRGDLKEAKLRLDCAMAAGQELAGCCYVRAMLAGAIGDYSRASEECAKAAYAEPFNVRYLFFWAECLRRSGRMQESITHFQEALNRPASPTDQDYIAFKLRLAQIEAGRSGEFAAEMATQLSAGNPTVYWLLTAAALQLEAQDPGTASVNLQKASKLVLAADFDLLLRDYLLTSHATEKEIAPFFVRTPAPASPSPNVAAITVDPLSWTLQSADPASWPTAAQAR